MTDPPVLHGDGSQSTSSTLLYRAREMDAAAWDQLVRLYGPLVYRWCRREGLQEHDAADVGQEVFHSVSRCIGRFDRERGSFRAWLKAVTRTKVADFHRRRSPGRAGVGGGIGAPELADLAAPPAADSDDPATDPEEKLFLLRKAMEMILADVTEINREAFLRVVVDGRDPAEVARELGVPVNRVHLAKSRIKRRLQKFDGLIDLTHRSPPVR